MRGLVLFLVVMGVAGCSSMRYPNWQYVRIENQKPDPSCEYKIQETCSKPGDKCYVFYKKRATKFGANTVVITSASKDVVGESGAMVFKGSGGANANIRTDITAFADYYYCPAPAAH